MGGEIALSSEEGVGSEFSFRITLPLDASVPIAHADPVVQDLAGKSVLVVDDLALNRDILSRRVASWGMRPFVAESGMEALRVAAQEHVEGDGIDIAIVDFQMPEMDGARALPLLQDALAAERDPDPDAVLGWTSRCREAG